MRRPAAGSFTRLSLCMTAANDDLSSPPRPGETRASLSCLSCLRVTGANEAPGGPAREVSVPRSVSRTVRLSIHGRHESSVVSRLKARVVSHQSLVVSRLGVSPCYARCLPLPAAVAATHTRVTDTRQVLVTARWHQKLGIINTRVFRIPPVGITVGRPAPGDNWSYLSRRGVQELARPRGDSRRLHTRQASSSHTNLTERADISRKRSELLSRAPDGTRTNWSGISRLDTAIDVS